MPKCNSIGANAERRTPLFSDGFGKTCDAGFGEGVVRLPGVTVDAGGGGDVDDVAWLAVFDAEVGCCCADELEGCCAVEADDSFPLLVRCLYLVSAQ